MDEPPLAMQIAFILIAVVVAAIAAYCGAFSNRAFDRVAPRKGSLGLHDVVLTIGLVLIGGALPMLLLRLAGRDPIQMLESASTAARLVLQYLAMTPALAYVLFRAATAIDGGLSGFGLGLSRLFSGVVYGVIGAVVIIPLTTGVSNAMFMLAKAVGIEVPMIAHDVLKVMTEMSEGSDRMILIIGAVVVAPLAEELLVRGMVQTALIQWPLRLSRWPAILITSVLFALMHFSSVHPLVFPVLFVLSIGLGWVYERTGSLWAPICMHSAFNGSQVVIALAMARQTAGDMPA